jgi:inner membrane protein
MPTVMTHAAFAFGLGRIFTARRMPRVWFWDILIVLSILPDLDILAFRLGIPYENPFGHRGFSHSLLFAWTVSLLAAAVCFRKCQVRFWDLWGLFFVSAASHGLLDALTNGGLGIAFFWPSDNERYFFPWQPIEVSELGYHFFMSSRAWRTLGTELLWVWLPIAIVVGLVELFPAVRGLWGEAARNSEPASETANTTGEPPA